MAHLIDKDALVAEFERRISQLESEYKKLSNLEIWITAKEIEHKINGLKEALSIVNTLEMKEVDLQRGLYDIKRACGIFKENDIGEISGNCLDWVAQRYFELGIKVAQKGEEV